MNINTDSAGTQIIVQSIRSLLTLAGLGGVVVIFIESGTGRFIETFERLAHAADIFSNLAG